MFNIPWYIYLLQFVAGVFLANGVPHFVQGISGHWFQSPFASPPGIGESSPVVNVLWGFLNLAVGFALLFKFAPKGRRRPRMGVLRPGRAGYRHLLRVAFRAGEIGAQVEQAAIKVSCRERGHPARAFQTLDSRFRGNDMRACCTSKQSSFGHSPAGHDRRPDLRQPRPRPVDRGNRSNPWYDWRIRRR
jgi:hypothetical protein